MRTTGSYGTNSLVRYEQPAVLWYPQAPIPKTPATVHAEQRARGGWVGQQRLLNCLLDRAVAPKKRARTDFCPHSSTRQHAHGPSANPQPEPLFSEAKHHFCLERADFGEPRTPTLTTTPATASLPLPQLAPRALGPLTFLRRRLALTLGLPPGTQSTHHRCGSGTPERPSDV